MAGIGWRLERLIARDSLGGTVAAYATGAAVIALPWLLTAVVLAVLSGFSHTNSREFAMASTVAKTAYIVALLVAAPIQVVATRVSADRLYERRFDAIGAPLLQALALVLLLCAGIAASWLAIAGFPIEMVWCGSALAAAVGAQWTALSVGNGLCSPSLVVGAVVSGAATSLVLAGLGSQLGMRGYLLGLDAGPCVALAVIVAAIRAGLPESESDRSGLLAGFRRYANLAASALAFNVALWIDKQIVESFARVGTDAAQAAGSVLAWVAAVPALTWVFIETETSLHRRVRSLLLDLESGATLDTLDGSVAELASSVAGMFRSVIVIHAGASLFGVIAAPHIVSVLGLSAATVVTLRVLLVATCCQVLSLVALIVLYFLDRRREALMAACASLVAISIGTAAAIALRLTPAIGTACGSAIGALVGRHLANQCTRTIIEHALLGTPTGS